MKKFAKNPWVLGIGTTIIGGVLLSFLLDWIKGINWLSTLKSFFEVIVNALMAFLNFELKVWWVLVAIVFVIVAFFVIAKIYDAKSKNDTPAFSSYTKDCVLGYMWEWEYAKNFEGKYTISNLHPVCSKCGMRLKQDGAYGREMTCLRCNTNKSWKDSYLTDAQMLIEDNVKKKYLQKQ